MSGGINITIIYDNNRYENKLRAGLGISCLISTGKRNILFDTGSHGPTLLYNMRALGVEPAHIDTVVLSHIDTDHTGGLLAFLQENNAVKVYVPQSFPRAFKDLIVLHTARVISVSAPVRIVPGMGITGELGDGIREQSLIMRGGDKLAVLIGDAHPGVFTILDRVRELLGMKIGLIAGGFHLEGDSDAELKEVANRFRSYGIERVAAFHSCGDGARRVFAQEFGSGYIESGVGAVIEI